MAQEQENFAIALQDSLDSFLKEYNRSKKYTMIFNKAVMLYADPAMDITSEVVAGLNKRYQKNRRINLLCRNNCVLLQPISKKESCRSDRSGRTRNPLYGFVRTGGLNPSLSAESRVLFSPTGKGHFSFWPAAARILSAFGIGAGDVRTEAQREVLVRICFI